MFEVEQIKDSLIMSDILGQYGIKPNNSDFIICPFHNENTASCKIYKTSWRCFGCGLSGDIIDFVSLIENISFAEAIRYIDNVFSLGIFDRPTLTKFRKYKNRKRYVKNIKDELKKLDEEYWNAFDEYVKQSIIAEVLKPTIERPVFDELYCTAVNKIPYLEYLLDDLQIQIKRGEADCRNS